MIRQLTHEEIKALHLELKLKDILATAEKLPPFPGVVWKVMSLIRKTAPVQEIEAVIKYDQAIAAKVLAMSQSPYFARRSGVKSLHDAILILGSQRLVQVVMTACAASFFHGEGPRAAPKEEELWRHSVATALMGEILARRLKLKRALGIYTACLLHDLGKTVLDRYARTYLGSSLREMQAMGVRFIAAERAALGIDHQELGGIIARRWHFPDEVIAGIAHHHSPELAPEHRDVVRVVYVADRIVTLMDAEKDVRDKFDCQGDPVFRSYAITAALLEPLETELQEALQGVVQLLTRSS